MRFLLGAFIFLSSSTLWSQIYLICDASHIFYPNYENRITFIFPNYEESPTTTIVIKYQKFNNVFFENKTDFYIKPYEMFTSKYKINRETGKLTRYGEKTIARQCKEYDSKSWDKEKKKQEDWLTKQLKKRKF